MRTSKAIAIALVSGLLFLSAAARAAVDPFNLLGAGFLEPYGGGGNEIAYVRKSDGSIWYTQVPSHGWFSIGKPSTGATSGPQAASILNGGIHNLVFVEVGNVIFANDGGTWSSFLPSPPGGFTSGLAVSSNQANNVIHIAARGGSNLPFVISVGAPEGGGSWIVSSWNQVGTSGINGAPGIAETSFRQDLLALDGSSDLEMNTCQYPACFPGYTSVPGPVIGVSSPSGIWFDLLGNNGGPFMAAAVGVSGGNAVVDTFTNSTNAFGGAVSRGGGGKIDGPVTVTIISPQNPLVPRLAAHFNDGNYYYNPSGLSWFSLGHP